MSEHCRSCGAPVTWAIVGHGGKYMPLDTEPTPDGIVKKVGELDNGLPVVEVDDGPSLLDDGTERRFTTHFATCPDADGWRKT